MPSSEHAFQDRGLEVTRNRETPGKNEELGDEAGRIKQGKHRTRATSGSELAETVLCSLCYML